MLSLPRSVFVLFFVISLAYCDTSLLWGESGAGKSSELNCLAGQTLAKEALVQSGQEYPELHKIGDHLLVDVPGFMDTRGTTDDEIRERIWNFAKQHSTQLNGGIDRILVVVPSRGKVYLKNVLAQAFMLFSPASIANMVFLFNHSPGNPHREDLYKYTIQLVTALGANENQVLKLDAKNCPEEEKRLVLEKMRSTSPGGKIKLSDSSLTHLEKWATNYFDNVLMKDPANYEEKIEKIPRVEKRVVPKEIEVEEAYTYDCGRRRCVRRFLGVCRRRRHVPETCHATRKVKKIVNETIEEVVYDIHRKRVLKNSKEHYMEKALEEGKKVIRADLDKPAVRVNKNNHTEL